MNLKCPFQLQACQILVIQNTFNRCLLASLHTMLLYFIWLLLQWRMFIIPFIHNLYSILHSVCAYSSYHFNQEILNRMHPQRTLCRQFDLSKKNHSLVSVSVSCFQLWFEALHTAHSPVWYRMENQRELSPSPWVMLFCLIRHLQEAVSRA